MEFRVLGPLEVVEGERQLTPKGSRLRALLVLLLTSANEAVSSDRLIDELWGEDPPREAANALQYHVSQLRKALAEDERIVTREPGYAIRVEQDELDLLRFQRLVTAARDAPAEDAARLLREALALWRGAALADLENVPAVQAEAQRLEDLRVAAIERRIDADLALGRRSELVAELEALTREHPYRETFRGQLMLALYGSGRQAEALGVYRDTRRLLDDELGLEPGRAIQQLEQAILRQDPSLEAPDMAPRTRGSITVLVDGSHGLLAIAEPLARKPPRELILATLLEHHDAVASATTSLATLRNELAVRGVTSRVAAYTTVDAGSDVALLATQHDSDLLLLSASLNGERLPKDVRTVLERAPCDVGLLAGGTTLEASGPIVTPFGGVDHDWSAIELAAWLAGSLDIPLRLVGTEADETRRDASRLLARASLLVQQVVGIVTEPVLVPAGKDGVLSAATDARLLVMGLSDRWRSEGIGATRLAVAADAGVPTLFVRRGLRPGGVAPSETLTRFTWTLGSA